MAKIATWGLEEGKITVEYTTAAPLVPAKRPNPAKEPKFVGELIQVVPGFRVAVRLDVAKKIVHVMPTSVSPANALYLVELRIQALLVQRLAWRRRLKLPLRMPIRSFHEPNIPETNAQAAMIKTLRGFDRLAMFARYMTHITPAATILERVHYWTWRAGVLPFDAGPVMTRAEWKAMVGRGGSDDADQTELLVISQVYPGLCNDGNADNDVTVRAQLMATVPEFAPRIRTLYWYDGKHDAREMDRLLSILSSQGARNCVFHPAASELVVFLDTVAPDLQDERVHSLAACIVAALLGFPVDDTKLALETVSDEKLQWAWTVSAQWIDDRTLPERRPH